MFLHVKGYSRSKVTWGQIWFCCTSHQGPHWKPESSLYCVFDVDMHSPCPQAGAEGSWLRVSVCPRSFNRLSPQLGGLHTDCTLPAPPHTSPSWQKHCLGWAALAPALQLLTGTENSNPSTQQCFSLRV